MNATAAVGTWRRVKGARVRHLWVRGTTGMYELSAACGGWAADAHSLAEDEPDRRKCRHCNRQETRQSRDDRGETLTTLPITSTSPNHTHLGDAPLVQIGWLGHKDGRVYRLDEDPSLTELGGWSPIYRHWGEECGHQIKARETAVLAVPPSGVKMLRETLCVAQGLVLRRAADPRSDEHGGRLQSLIDECDRHRPIDSVGTHGEGQHTPTCGCEDAP